MAFKRFHQCLRCLLRLCTRRKKQPSLEQDLINDDTSNEFVTCENDVKQQSRLSKGSDEKSHLDNKDTGNPKIAGHLQNAIAEAKVALKVKEDTGKKQCPKEDQNNRELPSIPVVIYDPATRFADIEQIGKGAFGKVFKARLKDTTVAVKVVDIRKGQTDNNEAIQEIRILERLNQHNNIVTFYDAVIHKTRPQNKLWCTMEYCGGGSLADIISSTRNQSLPERSIQYISREVLKGLDYIHNNLVIHTDIKGANIVLTEQAEVKIIDFGLAKEIRYPGQRVSEYSGTPWYMAPEVIITLYLPEIGYTVKCDIWSFGITIIEMAQGDPPNRDMPAERAKINIFRGDPPELKSKRWSTDIRDFLKLCLTKADQERPGAKVLLRHQFITNQPNENEARLAFIQCLNEGKN
ncbi:hypothetical protein XENTR_v10019526 [Xenopus tropicalis]|nr:hypothetical protein XENTR_v10019526 [Xenopus tropicalis]